MARLFIGVWLSPVLRDEVVNYMETIRKNSLGFKWTIPEQLHFTLKFLGEVTTADRNRLIVKLQEVADRTSEFTVALGAPGQFPNVGNPRIAWIGLSRGEAAMKNLANCVEAFCVAAGFAAADKPFRPHLTIARARPDCPLQLALAPDVVFDNSMKVQSFDLVESRLTSSGSVYRSVGQFPLKRS